MDKEFKNLQREEDILYGKLEEYVSMLTDKEIQEFNELLSKYVDVQIELEKFCGE